MSRWYYYLNRKGERNLLQFEKIEDDTLIIGDWSGKKRYTTFGGHVSYYDYQLSVPYSSRCFFEILLPHTRRKPYFDIDMKKSELPKDFNSIKFIKRTVKAIRKTIESDEDYSILVFSSHTDRKWSFHIVVDKLYLQNYEECAFFFNKVLESGYIQEEYIQFFDDSVYKKTQQFRMIWSHKYERGNTKKLDVNLSYNFKIPSRYAGERGRKLFILHSSLVGRVENCKILMGFAVPKSERRIMIEGSATENDLEEVIKLFSESVPYKRGSFEIGDVVEDDGNLIVPLRSLHPYHCDGCGRVHDAENPYLTVRGEERTILFDCRRGKNRQFVGKLGPPPPPVEAPLVTLPPLPPPPRAKEKPSPPRLENLMKVKRVEKYKPQITYNLKLGIY